MPNRYIIAHPAGVGTVLLCIDYVRWQKISGGWVNVMMGRVSRHGMVGSWCLQGDWSMAVSVSWQPCVWMKKRDCRYWLCCQNWIAELIEDNLCVVYNVRGAILWFPLHTYPIIASVFCSDIPAIRLWMVCLSVSKQRKCFVPCWRFARPACSILGSPSVKMTVP